jgi:coenzyme Q-binding protein COQ10
MPTFEATRRVAVPAAVAFAVASDVASYKDFLPLVEASTVRGSVSEANGVKTFNAAVSIGYTKLNLRETFYSRVVCDATARTVTATSEEPPFRKLAAIWTIGEIEGLADVSISIDYVMRSMLLQFALAGAMDMAVSKIMTAFETRSKSLYNASKTS